MRNFFNFIAFLLFCAVFSSCNEKDTLFGVDMMPSGDLITQTYSSYGVPTETFEVGDSVLSRTSMSYLGRYTDPETNSSVKGEFVAQYYVNENYELFPDSIVNNKVTGADVRLYVKSFVGDSLANFKVSVYDLSKELDAEADYYTNFNPLKYIDDVKEPIATKFYSLSDKTITDAERDAKGYLRNIRITLPTDLAQKLYDAYHFNNMKFVDTGTWLHSGLPFSKGLYFKLDYGDGAMAYIDITQINIYYSYYNSVYGKDTTSITRLTSTEEVIEATSFDNSDLTHLLGDNSATYLKTPAGLFTLATLPVDSINTNDTINSASITFTRFNDVAPSQFKPGIPNKLLMVRYDDYINGYFNKYSIADNKTSFLTTYNSVTNAYSFDNISRLIAKCLQEKKSGKASPNYNKVLLIPVETNYDTQNALVKLNHDFSVGSARLVRGHATAPGEQTWDETRNVFLKVVYSKFNNSVK